MQWVWLAQAGSEAAADVVEKSLQLTEQTAQSWNEAWLDVIGPGSELWVDIIDFSRGVLALCLLYMFVRYGNEIMKTQYIGSLVELFIFPVVIMIFLGGQGKLLSAVILSIRSIGYSLTTGLLSKQLLGYELDTAVTQFRMNNIGVQRLKQLYSECEGQTGDPFLQCWDSKASEADAIVNQLQSAAPNVSLDGVSGFSALLQNATVVGGADTLTDIGSGLVSGGISGAFAAVIQDRLLPLIQAILYGLQWAFVNIIEASLLIAAVIAPIALALSLLPVGGRPIWAWASGFLGLIGLQIGYNVLVGIVAVILANTDGGAIEISQNLGFLLFISIFAPGLVSAFSAWSATALYSAISRRANSVASAISGGVSSMAKFAVLRKT